jgi:tetratricopeptide (TPR) repeat protein
MKQSLRGFSAVAVALAIAMYAAPAAAQVDESEHLATARQALAALKYEQALHALEKALYSGRNGAGDMASIYRMMGEIQAALGQQEQAEGHFRHLLALEPAAELARGVSPKIQQPFQAARTYMSTRGRLEVGCRVDEAAQAVELTVASDPTALVAGARVVYRLAGGGEQILEVAGKGSQTLRVPTAAPVTLICAALDEHGNRLSEIGSWSEPLRLAPPAPAPQPIVSVAPPAEAPAPPFYGRWWVWGTAAVLAAGGGGYFGWQARADQDELDRLNQDSQDHDFAEAEEIERRGRRNALIANVSFGTAGAFAIAAVLSLVLEPDAPAAERATGSAAVAPLPLRQGAGLSVAFTF